MTVDHILAGLQGRKVTLRDWVLDDHDHGPDRDASWKRPGHRWQEFDGSRDPRASDAKTTPTATPTASIASLRSTIVASTWFVPRSPLAIADLESGELHGFVSWDRENRETNWPNAGITLFDHGTKGKGIGFDALGWWSDCHFATEPAIGLLDLPTWPGGHGMKHLAGNLGYVREARFCRARIVNGLHDGGMGYGILRDEWTIRYPNGFAAFCS